MRTYETTGYIYLYHTLEGKRDDRHNESPYGWKPEVSSLETMMEQHAKYGKALMPCELKHVGRCDEHLSSFDCFIVDIDNADPDGEMTTWKQAMDHPFIRLSVYPFIRDNAAVMWTLANHRRVCNDNDTDYDHVINIDDRNKCIELARMKYQGQDRYRVLFLLSTQFSISPAGNKMVINIFRQYIKAVSQQIPGFDSSIKPSQYFAGSSDGDVYYFDETYRLYLNQIDLSQKQS